MTDARHPVWTEGGWAEVPVASLAGEPLVVPNVAGLVFSGDDRRSLLLQRRDKPGEEVRGHWEVPSGRWRAGETPWGALVREVEEETGLRVRRVQIPSSRHEAHPRRPFLSLEPPVVTVGVEGAYPALHLAFPCVAEGEPRPQPGETADPRWYPVAELPDLIREPSRFTGSTLAILRAWLSR